MTGDYRFCCAGVMYRGRAAVSRKGSIFTLTDNAIDRRLIASVDSTQNKGTAAAAIICGGRLVRSRPPRVPGRLARRPCPGQDAAATGRRFTVAANWLREEISASGRCSARGGRRRSWRSRRAARTPHDCWRGPRTHSATRNLAAVRRAASDGVASPPSPPSTEVARSAQVRAPRCSNAVRAAAMLAMT